MSTSPEMTGFVQRFDQLVGNVSRVMHGKDQVVRAAVSCVLAEGHLLKDICSSRTSPEWARPPSPEPSPRPWP